MRPWIAKAEDVQLAMDRAAMAGIANFEPGFNPGDEIYQTVVGECRYWASVKAKKETVPATVRSVSNEQAEIIQNIENLQRKDLSVLAQARSFERLVTKGLTGDEIAIEVGKSPQWVSSMKRLNSLAPFVREVLLKKWISPGHAVLIARLGDSMSQENALRAVFDCYGVANGSIVNLLGQAYEDHDGDIMSEKGLRTWIANNIKCDLKKVAWDLADKDLYPEAGACIGCEHNTGTDQALFEGIVADGEKKCAKPVCFQAKIARQIQREIDNADMTDRKLVQITVKESNEPLKEGARIVKQGQWVRSAKGECKDTEQALMRDGPEAAHVVWVCINHRCKVHPHSAIVQSPHSALSNQQSAKEEGSKPAQAAGNGAARVGSTTSVTAVQKSEREEKLEFARRLAEGAVHETIVEQVLAAEVKKIKAPDVELLRGIAGFQLETFHNDLQRIVVSLGHGTEADADKIIPAILKTGSLTDLTRLIFLLQVPDNLPFDGADFKAHARRAGVDVAKLRKELERKIEVACFYCGCTELTPCEGGCDRTRTTASKLNFCNSSDCKEKFEKEHAAPLISLPVNGDGQKPLNTEDTEKHRGKAKGSTAKGAKGSNEKPKSKPAAKPAKKGKSKR
jgi:ParB/RepB/Spo0J family partition protein